MLKIIRKILRQDKIDELNKKIEIINQFAQSLKEQNKKLIDEANFKTTEEQTRGYWNNKWPKNDITYIAREDKIRFDVRNFIYPNDCIIKGILKKNQLISNDNDEIALRCLQWILMNIKYISDNFLFGFMEQWDFPDEVLFRKKADCEGGSHLYISMLRNAGIPAYRCKVAVGFATNGSQRFYHSYPIYLRESDNEWVIMDWNSAEINWEDTDKRIKAKENKFYEPPDFTFNDEYSWSQKSFEIENGFKK